MEVRGEFIVLERIQKAQGDFVLPDDEKDTFIVHALGPDVKGCQVGDEVIAITHFGSFDLDGKKYEIIKDEDVVLCVK